VSELLTNIRGSSVIEVLTVLSIAAVLGGIAVPQAQVHILEAKEAVLNYNLKIMEQLLEIYMIFHGNYPEELSLLVKEGYLKEIPPDPFTGDRAYDYDREKGRIYRIQNE